MRQRIKVSTQITEKVITVKNVIVLFKEDSEQHQRGIRRSEFEKNYKRRNLLFRGIRRTSELDSFSRGIEEQIKQFKLSRI